MQYCPHLSFLVLSHCCTGDNVLQGLANHCRELSYLHLSGTDITNDGVLVVAKNCLKLESLDIAETNCSVRALQAGFPELILLDVCMCLEMDAEDVLTAVMRGCPKLEQLSADDNGQCLEWFLQGPTEDNIIVRIQHKMLELEIH